jgi:hypothetical protein
MLRGPVNVLMYIIAAASSSSRGPLAYSAPKSGGITRADPRNLPARKVWLAIAWVRIFPMRWGVFPRRSVRHNARRGRDIPMTGGGVAGGPACYAVRRTRRHYFGGHAATL